MSESEQEQSTTPRFSKAVLGRILAVGFFVVLGTFAVVHSMKGTQLNAVKATVNLLPDDAEQQTDTDEDGDNSSESKKAISGLLGDRSTANPAGSKTDKAAKPTGFQPNNFSAPVNNATVSKTNSPRTGAPFSAQPPVSSFDAGKSITPPKTQNGKAGPGVDSKTTRKPAERYAQLPTGVPVIGSKNGFGQRPDPTANTTTKPPTRSFGDYSLNKTADAASKSAADATNKLKTDVGNGASELLQKAKESIDEKAKAATEDLSQKLGGSFGPGIPSSGGSFGNKSNPANPSRESLRNDSTQKSKPSSLFGERPTALSKPPTQPSSQTFTDPSPTKPKNQGQPGFGAGGNKSAGPIANRIGTDNPSSRPDTRRPNASGPFGAPVNPGTDDANVNSAKTNNNPFGVTQTGPKPGNRPAQDTRQSFSPPNPANDSAAQRLKVQAQPISTNSLGNRSNGSYGGPGSQPIQTQPNRQLSPGNRLGTLQPSGRMSNNNAGASGISNANPGLAANRNALTRNVPGDRKLDGMQAPALTIEKLSPREIQLNQTASFEIVVKNVGRATAEDVIVTDEIPAGTKFNESTPQPENGGQNRNLQWNLGQLRPGQEKRIRLKLTPVQPGEMGSVAHVTFSTQASMRTLVTKPVLQIMHQTNQKTHLIGDNVVLDVVVTNTGDGAAKNVIIQQDVPLQLEFPDGLPGGSRGIEYEIGTLMPGKSRRVRLALKAADVGKVQNVMHASADGGLTAKHDLPIEVVAPKLMTRSTGATRRFLKRNVEHEFSVTNQGTADATNVELVAKLPRGLRFLQSNNQGRYDSNTHAVYWSLAELAKGVEAKVKLMTTPIDVGNQPISFEASADLDVRSKVDHALSVEHLDDVFFDIDDVVDPIEIGSDTSYRLRIVNQGTKAATNIQLGVDFPVGLIPTSVEGSLRHQIQGQRISFEPINSMSPGDELTLVINGKGQTAGDHRVVVNMSTDGRSTPVSKQESTRVYADR